MIICCSTICYRQFSFERAIAGISRTGFRYIELLSIPRFGEHVRPEDLGSDGIVRTGRLLEDHGLALTSVSGHIQNLVKKSDDTRVALEALRRRVELASELGAKYVNTGAWTLDRKTFYDTVGDILDFCRSRNVVLGLEVGEPGLTATGRGLIELLKPIETENIGINYDTGNVRCLTGMNPEEDLPEALGRLVHMHVKDHRGGKGVEQFPALGDGEVDFAKVFDIIKTKGFEGPFSLEIENDAEDPSKRDDDLRRSYDFLKRYLASR